MTLRGHPAGQSLGVQPPLRLPSPQDTAAKAMIQAGTAASTFPTFASITTLS